MTVDHHGGTAGWQLCWSEPGRDSRHAQDYPAAVTGSSASGGDAVASAVAWFTSQVRRQDGTPLLYLPGRRQTDSEPELLQLSKVRGVVTETWKTLLSARWAGGPVLAAWPDEVHLARIADDSRTTALCVIPWNDEGVAAWVRASNPELIGSNPVVVNMSRPLVEDPVVEQALKTLTQSVNHANNLAGAPDKRDAVATLLILHDGGHQLHPPDIYAWAPANGWPARGALRLRELAATIAGGKRPQLKHRSPFRKDILSVWQQEAADDE